jgi:hypothetical protein
MLILLGSGTAGGTLATTETSGLVKGVEIVSTDRFAIFRGGGTSVASGAVLGVNGSAAGVLVTGLSPGITVQRGAFLLSSQNMSAEKSAHLSGLPETSVAAVVSAATACAAAGLVIGEEPPAEPSYGNFTVLNMMDLDISAAGGDIYTTLSIRFDYDWSTKEFRKALLLEAPAQIKYFGRIPYTLEAKWLKSPRQAYLLGERMLGYLSRPRWGIPFTTGIEAEAIPPGVWVPVTHPHVPVSGRMLVMNSELDPSTASVRLTVEAIVGDKPEIVLAKLSEAYAPQLPDGISVSYIAGYAVFAINDEDGKPLTGAKVTLDGGLTLSTDTFGKVSFQTGRGTHHLKIEATGYVTQELDVTV